MPTHKNNQANPTRNISSLKNLWPYLRPYRGKIGLALVFLCLGSVTILLIPLAFRDLIDFGFSQQHKVSGGLFGALSLNERFLSLFGLACLWAVMISARYYIVSWIGERVIADLRSAVYGRVLLQSSQFFETLQTGEVLSRLTGDTTLVQTVVESSVSMGLRSLFQFTCGMFMMAVTSFYLFSLNLGLMAFLVIPLLAIGRKVKRLSRESQDKIADASALAGEILNAVPTVQAYTQEQHETQRFTDSAEASFITNGNSAYSGTRRINGIYRHCGNGFHHLCAVDRRKPGANWQHDRRATGFLYPVCGYSCEFRQYDSGSLGRHHAGSRRNRAFVGIAPCRTCHCGSQNTASVAANRKS
jgi:ATP-binding cassette subfamily B protein